MHWSKGHNGLKGTSSNTCCHKYIFMSKTTTLNEETGLDRSPPLQVCSFKIVSIWCCQSLFVLLTSSEQNSKEAGQKPDAYSGLAPSSDQHCVFSFSEMILIWTHLTIIWKQFWLSPLRSPQAEGWHQADVIKYTRTDFFKHFASAFLFVFIIRNENITLKTF